MTREESMYQAALKALEDGNHPRAKDLLTRLIKANPRNPQYWLWMSSVVSTEKERTFCLKEVLRLDPASKEARIGLTMLGELPQNQDLILPYEQQKRNWETTLVKEFEGKTTLKNQKNWITIGMVLGALVILITLVLTGALGLENSPIALLMKRRPTPTVSKILPTYAAVTAEPEQTLPALQESPTVIAELRANYTPTPLYVNTPHPVTEAYRTGIRAFERGNWDEAIQYMRQVIAIEPDSPDLYYYIGESQRMKGDLKSALSTFGNIIQDFPGFAPAYLGRARARLADTPGRWQEAQNDLEQAVNLDSGLFDAYIELATLEISRENSGEALVWLEQAEQLKPDSPLLYYSRAKTLLLAGDVDAAIDNAGRSTELDITFLDGYRLLAEAYITAGQAAEAVPALETYNTYQEGDAQALTWLGMAYYAKGDLSNSLNAFNRALEADSRLFEAYLQRGVIYTQEEAYQKAQEDLETALSINKESFLANLTLGINYLQLGFAGNAYQQFSISEAYAEEPYDLAQIYYWRAQSLERLDEEVAALRDWQALLRLNPEAVPGEWIRAAEERISGTYTSTPTPLTPTVANTRQPTATLAPTQTRWPTLTPTP